MTKYKKLTLVLILVISLATTAIAVAQSNSLASGKSPDFDKNGIVGYSDFFLFSNSYGQAAGPENNNNQFDLNDDKIINFTDFLLFISYFGKKITAPPNVGEKCKEIFPGFNGPANERINIVFMAFNYDSINIFLDKVKSLTNPNQQKSFFNYEPIKSNKNKFNLWYVNNLANTPIVVKNISELEYTPELFEIFNNLIKECGSTNGKNTLGISVINKEFFSSAVPIGNEDVTRGYTGYTYLSQIADYKTLFHEMGHMFADLDDEYITGQIQTQSRASLNCDIADSKISCPKWCSGPAIPIETFKNKKCSQFSLFECLEVENNESPCMLLLGNGNVGKAKTCLNYIDYCTSITNKDECVNTNNNFYQRPLCAWSSQVHPYFKSNCIPYFRSNFNIGTECIKGTGCYNGCGNATGIFRSTMESVMEGIHSKIISDDLTLGVLNEKLFCDKIKESTGSVGGKCPELFELFK